MKLLAAHRAGVNTVLLPKRNEKDLDDLPQEVREALKIILVERIDDALPLALSEQVPGEDMAMAANG
jgi:ATP-dependent Lon protease